MGVELVPKNPGQHLVTFVPKVTTDLPFFNLTYRKKDIPNKIEFEGKDDAGNPIHWEVRHNTDDDIGYAGVQAHEVWYLLIKPAIDASRMESGKIPKIVPLGGVRECLRWLGWTEGGHQAKDLIKALTQISFAGVIADLWFPTGEIDAEGKPTFKQVKGRFSRMSIYAIGEQHFTQEDLKQNDFEFDLSDVIYIILDPLEIMLQEVQADKQRLIDNQYMFSVKPVARRWYELMAGKVFGTLKYKKEFFEIRYSSYVKHHHNLKKQIHKFRVVEQMNRVVADHLASGFLKGVEYRKFKEVGQEHDFIIRYYVGQTAQDSVNRIKGHLLNRERKKNIEIKRAEKHPLIKQSNGNIVDTSKQHEKLDNVPFLDPETIPESREDLAMLTDLSQEQILVMQEMLTKYQVSWKKTYELTKQKFEECKKQLAALPFRELNMLNKAGFLIKAIEESYSLPDKYFEHLEKLKRDAEQHLRKEIIKNCLLCDETGYRNVKSDFDKHYGVMHQCTHDEDIEKQFEDQK